MFSVIDLVLVESPADPDGPVIKDEVIFKTEFSIDDSKSIQLNYQCKLIYLLPEKKFLS